MSNLPRLTQQSQKRMIPRAQSNHIRQNQQQTLSIFEIIPKEIIFSDIQNNKIYEHEIIIRNLSKQSKRFKIIQPQSSKFRCDYDIQGSLASGLMQKIVVIFESSQLANFHDKLKIQTEDNVIYEIPLNAFIPQCKVEYESLINFGFVRKGTEKVIDMTFKNTGSIQAKVELIAQSFFQQFQILNNSKTIMPDQEATISFVYSPTQVEIFRKIIQVKINNVIQSVMIDVNGTCIEFNIYLMNTNDIITNQISFGTFYMGKKENLEYYLMNNTPNPIEFKSLIMQGEVTVQQNNQIMTPSELGAQQTQKTIICQPNQGVVKPYDKIMLKFVCETKVTDQALQAVKDYSKIQNENKIINQEIIYTALFNFQGDENYEPLIVKINGKPTFPTLKISNHDLNFGICKLNEKRDLYLEIINLNTDKGIDINFEKLPYIHIQPQKLFLKSKESFNFQVGFLPKKLGPYKKKLNLNLICNQYQIPLNIKAICQEIEQIKKHNGIERDIHEYQQPVQFVHDLSNQDLFLTTTEKDFVKMRPQSTNINLKMTNNYLLEQRNKRIQQDRQKIRREKSQSAVKKNQNTLIENKKKEFITNYDLDDSLVLQEPKLNLPSKNDDLFVLKPIGQFDIQHNNNEQKNIFMPDSNQKVRIKFGSEPQSYLESKYSKMELTGEQLQRIFAGPKVIDFGVVNVKSLNEKTFHVRNDLNFCIQIHLVIDSEELKQSHQESQIIPSGKSAGFDIILYSPNTQKYTGTVKYMINKKYEFFFQVQADIQPIKIELQKQQINLNFSDDNQDLYTSENFRMYNTGNSIAYYKWIMPEKQIFQIHPVEDFIKPGQYKESIVKYYPSGNHGGKPDEDKFLLQVQDGINSTLKLIGTYNESKCLIVEKEINFQTISVCKKMEAIITIKNQQKFHSVFQVSKSLPLYVDIQPLQGKIDPDKTIILKLSFFSKVPIDINSEININFRGGKQQSIPFIVKTLVPDVTVIEKFFNFKSITTLEESGNEIMTIQNNSPITAILMLDLREKLDNLKDSCGLDCLEISPITDNLSDKDESGIMKTIEDDYQDPNDFEFQDARNEIQMDDFSDDSNYDMEDETENRCYQITVKPFKQIQFNLKFMPKDVKDYQIALPLILYGYGKLQNLQRNIYCKGMKPKFIMRPQHIEFKKKLVLPQVEKCYASFQDILITNPDNKMLYWKIDTQELDSDKVFQINPCQGRLDGGQSLIIKVSFNPLTDGEKKKQVPLYLDNNFKKPYCEIKLKGLGVHPRLNFDRREVILPLVPLNIPSVCTFVLQNDGYENFQIRHEIQQLYGNLDIDLTYIDGNMIGIQKSKIRIEVKFISNKSQSFTTKLSFLDENLTSYSITVSGTCDNSLISVFQYIQRSMGTFEIYAEDQKPLMLQLNEDSFCDDIEEKKSLQSKSQKSYKSILGYSPIPPQIIEKSLDAICRWINQNVMVGQQGVSQYPQDIIKSNGSQLFDIIYFLTNKQLAFKFKNESGLKKMQKINAIVKQYDDFLKYLKENGALLNSIRPHYLLNFQDFQCYIKSNQQTDDHKYVIVKLTEQAFNYQSNDAWIQVFYQIIKIFYLVRINKQMIKSIPNLAEEKKTLPDFYLEKSNIISSQEGIILRWLELNYECVFNQSKRLTNFEIDLKSSLHFAAAIRNYVGKSCQKFIQQMKRNCVSDEDFIYNADKLFLMLDEIGLVTHFNKKDLIFCNQRDTIIFLIQLMQALPHYIPKDQPVIFTCILGEEVIKEIELQNPTQKTINYWVNYEGHSDFSIKNAGNLEYECIKIDPKQSLNFKIKYTAKISIPVEGRLTFTNKKEGTVQASALVFELKSQVTERRSIDVSTCSAKLYQSVDHQIAVTNIFQNAQTDGDFTITIINEIINKKPVVVEEKSNKKKKNKKVNKQDQQDQQIEDTSIPDAFFTLKKSIQLKRGETQFITVQFMPFKLENYKCFIIFQDLKVGEFQYEINGTTDWPDPEEYKPVSQLFVDQLFKFDLNLPLKNNAINTLRRKHENRLLNAGKVKEREAYLNQVNNLPIYEYYEYDVCLKQQNASNVTVANSIKLYDPKYKKLKDEDRTQSFKNDHSNKLPVQMLFKTPIKDHSFQILIKNKFLTDIRIYKIVVTIVPKPIKAVLEMKVPFGDEIKQEIPIINNTDKDVVIKAQLDGDPSFTGPREFAVKKGATGYFQLNFKPLYSGHLESKLTLQNPVSNDFFEFKLSGISEEPIAQDHIQIKCTAKETSTTFIPITNKQHKPITYLVETDLINPEGLKSVPVQPGRTVNYQLKVSPILGGIYNGSITFIDSENPDNYIWFTVQLDIDRPLATKQVEIATQIRKAVIFETSITNPDDQEVVFEVLMHGDGLEGEETFSLAARETKTYQLMFIPIKVQTSKGFLSFMNPKLSEIWYDLTLTAQESPAINMNSFISEIGKYQDQQVYLDNPSDQQVKLSINNNNSQNFDVIPKEIVIPKYGQTKITFRYTPTLVNVEQSCSITLSSNSIGDFKYQLIGKGLPPTQFNEYCFTGSLNKELQLSIDFKNPYNSEIYFTCDIFEDNKNVFALLAKKSQYFCKANSICQIPFTFRPNLISQFSAQIVLKLNEEIQWKYPLRGVTELNLTNNVYSVGTSCGQQVTKTIEIYPPGIPDDIQAEEIRYEIQNIPDEYSYILQNCFHLKPIQKYISSPNDFLSYEIQMYPFKPFKCNLDLVLIRPNGGQWKYKLQLLSAEPEDFDVIMIESCLNKTASVSFKLNNKVKQVSKFKAFFCKESDPDFSISPQSGELNSIGSTPAVFVVSFTPKEYKAKNGRIIIETQDHYWSFQVKGTFQNYKPPSKNLLQQSKFQIKEHQKEQDDKRSKARSPTKNNLLPL